MNKKDLFISTMRSVARDYDTMKSFSRETSSLFCGEIHFENKVASTAVLNLLEKLIGGSYENRVLSTLGHFRDFKPEKYTFWHNGEIVCVTDWGEIYDELTDGRQNSDLGIADFDYAMSLISEEIRELDEYAEKFNETFSEVCYFDNICMKSDFLDLVETCFFGDCDGWLEYYLFEKEPQAYDEGEKVEINNWRDLYNFLKKI